jgi:predicted enzyme related to lactoylglutathione lyase
MMSAIKSAALGDFVWHDVLSHDPTSAAAFYCHLMGWTEQTMDVAGADHLLLVGPEGPVCGATPLPAIAAKAGIPPHWTSNVQVEDVDATVAAATRLGGKVVFPAADFPPIGRLAGIADPTGGSLHVYKPSKPAPQRDPRLPGNFAWSELTTPDPRAALDFYRAVFGWQKVRELAPGKRVVFGIGDRELGGIVENTGGPPAWLYYVRVPNIEGARVHAQTRGATVLSEAAVAAGRACHLVDPQGAAFGLIADG